MSDVTSSPQHIIWRTLQSWSTLTGQPGGDFTWSPSDIVYIRARDGDMLVHFECSTNILGRDSPIFARRVLGPPGSPRPTVDTVNGRPVFECVDDAKQLDVFLWAIHDIRVYVKWYGTKTWLSVTGILRLATKYEVKDLRNMMLHHIADNVYPRDPSTLSKVQSENLAVPLSQHLQAIRLFEETNARVFLPMVYYKIIAGFPSALALLHLPVEHPSDQPYPELIAGIGFPNQISRSLCINAWSVIEGLAKQRMRRISPSTLGHQVYRPCQSIQAPFPQKPSCHEVLLDWLVHDPAATSARALLNVSPLPQVVQDQLCARCLRRTKFILAATLRAEWHVLPSRFGLPGWAQLANELMPADEPVAQAPNNTAD